MPGQKKGRQSLPFQFVDEALSQSLTTVFPATTVPFTRSWTV